MKTSLNRGIISDHFQGVGTVTREMVQARAREIAVINGRPPNHCTKDDLREAQRELTGVIPGMDDEENTLFNGNTWGDEPGLAGHEVEKLEAPDEQTVGEELIEQGMNEAEHDLMVEAAKTRRVL